MGGDDKDGSYCSICGGIPPDKIKTKMIFIDGKETGIDQLDWILAEVKKLNLSDDATITEELLKRTQALNYVPTKKKDAYGMALLAEYRKFLPQCIIKSPKPQKEDRPVKNSCCTQNPVLRNSMDLFFLRTVQGSPVRNPLHRNPPEVSPASLFSPIPRIPLSGTPGSP